jgi:histidinol dehydrogenase
VTDSNIGIVVTPTLEAGARLANRLAPEHLSVVTVNPRAIADLVPDCGSVFLGSQSPVALGDYVAGSNHVLPTGGSARFGSPLGVYDFYKRSNLISLSTGTRRAIAPAGGVIAMFEGLPAHARSIEIREEQS